MARMLMVSTEYTGVETRTLTVEQAENYWGSVGERDEAHFTYDASFLKLRQITFGYDIPASLLSKTPIKTLNLVFCCKEPGNTVQEHTEY